MSKNSTSAMPASASDNEIPLKTRNQVMLGLVIVFAVLTLNNYLLVRTKYCPPKYTCSQNDEFLSSAVLFSLVFMIGMLLVAGILCCFFSCLLYFARCVRGTVIVSQRLAQEADF